VVIGSGPGGATAAHILAEHGKQVLILEEGPHLPLESCPPFSIQEMAQKYRAGGLNPTFGNARIAFVEACCAGGGSEINSGLYHRTPPEVLDQWRRDFDLLQTSSDDLLPHFKYNEDALQVGVCPDGAPAASMKMAEGAAQLGWRAMEVPRWFKYDVAKPAAHSTGTRQSMTKTYIPRALKAGAQLMPLTRALRLRRSGRGWSVTAVRGGRTIDIQADTVFMAAGAVQTPVLLRRSGIRKNVGNTLALHPTVKVVALFDEVVNHEDLGVPVHQVKEFSPRIGMGCSISSPPHLALALSGYKRFEVELKANWRRMASYYAMITGPNTGRIRPVFSARDPIIRYSLNGADLRDLAHGMRRLCTLLLRAGAIRVYPSISGAHYITKEEELSRIPGSLSPDRSNLMTIHLFASCPMGENEARCAVNSVGRVHGIPDLYICDASILCTAPGVNPQGSIMALARRNVLRFLDEL